MSAGGYAANIWSFDPKTKDPRYTVAIDEASRKLVEKLYMDRLDFSLTDNATSTPTSVTVTSPDLGFADDVFIGTVSSFPREFTVASGVITDANFLARRDTSSDFLILDSDQSISPPNQPFELCVSNCNSGTTVAGDSIAASSATFTPLGATPVPFEVNPGLGLFLVGGIWGVNKLRKKQNISS